MCINHLLADFICRLINSELNYYILQFLFDMLPNYLINLASYIFLIIK